MKKIPTLFVREFENGRVTKVIDQVTPGFEWVLNGDGVATLKMDGACCAIIDGVFYKRYDAKHGKKPPKDAIPCCDPDPVTGHWPHWVKVDPNNPADKWFTEAIDNSYLVNLYDTKTGSVDGTFEAVGPHFNGNPYDIDTDELFRHGSILCGQFERSFDGIRQYLTDQEIEGIVFWKDGEPQCKIKRTDFGLPWPCENPYRRESV